MLSMEKEMILTWLDALKLALALIDNAPNHGNERVLEAIQQSWIEEKKRIINLKRKLRLAFLCV